MRVGIIGGGAAGMAAAYELGTYGHRAVVYERAPFLGGHASTFDVGGGRLERGYHHWFTSDTDIVELVREIGLGHQIRWIDSKVGTLYEGRVYDFVTPMDLLRFSPLSLFDRIRLGLATLYLQRQKNWRRYETVTASEWLRRYVGRRAYDVFWGPMLRGKFGEEYYDQIGMTWLWGKMQTRFASRGRGLTKEKLGYPIGSFGEIFDVLAERIEQQGSTVHISSPVSRVVMEEGRARGLEVAVEGGPRTVEEFDAVIATTPSNVFPRLVPPLPDEYLSRLEGARYMSAVLIVLVMDRPTLTRILDECGGSLDTVRGGDRAHQPDRPEHYGGKCIVYLSNYLTPDHPMYRMSHQELLAEYVPHLRKINPEFEPSWIEESYHHRVDGAQPIVGTGYSDMIPDHRTPHRGVYLANTTQVYPEDRGTNYSVRMGRRVARMVMEDADPAPTGSSPS